MIHEGLQEFYNSLSDRPLEPGDPFYVPYLEEQDGGDPIAELATRIDWSSAASVNLLSGQRGSGKSTELRRLKKRLEDAGCIVFLSDMRDYMNLTKPVEISDFLISIMAALNEEVERNYGKDALKDGYWKRLSSFLKSAEVKFEEVGLKSDLIELKASLKDDPTFKELLQSKLRGHIAKLVRQSHEFSTEVVEFVRGKHNDINKKVIYLIDSVEQIRGVGVEAESVYQSVENLFSSHSDSLHLPLLHVVYTIPPYLTTLAPGLGSRLGGGAVFSIPSVHIFKQKTRNVSDSGIKIMKGIIGRRYTEWKKIFTDVQLNDLAKTSGGDIRDFFRLIKTCLVKATTKPTIILPIRDDIIQESIEQLRREMLPIAADDVEWLKRIGDRKEPELKNIKDLPLLARFFDTKLVLNYRNGQDWYDIHPLLQEYIK